LEQKEGLKCKIERPWVELQIEFEYQGPKCKICKGLWTVGCFEESWEDYLQNGWVSGILEIFSNYKSRENGSRAVDRRD
jgi:hypothetical protein